MTSPFTYDDLIPATAPKKAPLFDYSDLYPQDFSGVESESGSAPGGFLGGDAGTVAGDARALFQDPRLPSQRTTNQSRLAAAIPQPTVAGADATGAQGPTLLRLPSGGRVTVASPALPGVPIRAEDVEASSATRGLRTGAAGGLRATGQIAEMMGLEELAAILQERGRTQQLRSPLDEKGVGPAAAYGLGQGVASTIPSLGAGLIGGAVGGPVGAMAGAGLMSGVQNIGDVRGSLQEAGVDENLNALALLLGIPVAALDMYAPGRAAGALIASGRGAGLRGVGGAMLRSSRDEGLTEAAQQGIQAVGVGEASGQPVGFDQLIQQMFSAGVQGAAVGGLMGGVTEAGGQLLRREAPAPQMPGQGPPLSIVPESGAPAEPDYEFVDQPRTPPPAPAGGAVPVPPVNRFDYGQPMAPPVHPTNPMARMFDMGVAPPSTAQNIDPSIPNGGVDAVSPGAAQGPGRQAQDDPALRGVAQDALAALPESDLVAIGQHALEAGDRATMETVLAEAQRRIIASNAQNPAVKRSPRAPGQAHRPGVLPPPQDAKPRSATVEADAEADLEMQLRRSIKRGPPAARLSIPPPTKVAPAKPAVEAPAPIPGFRGKESKVTLPDGSKHLVRFRLVEADALQPSHNAQTFAPNPKYPEGVQGRRYHRDRAAQENVVAGVLRLDPDLLIRDTGNADGTPIITEGGIVLSGNQRTMMLQRAARSSNAQGAYARYVAALRQQLSALGIDPDAVDALHHPVLVREIAQAHLDAGDATAMQAFNAASDMSASKARSSVDEGMARAARLAQADGALTHFSETMGDQTLRAYLDGPNGRSFLYALVRDGVVNRAEMGGMVNSAGALTPEAKQLLEHTMYAAAVGDADVFERIPGKIKRKLDTAIPAIVRAGTAEGYSLQGPLQAALRELASVSAAGAGISSLGDLRAQGDAFGADPGLAVGHAVADFLERSSKAEVTEAFQRYAAGAREALAHGGGADIFGARPETPEQLAARVFRAAPEQKRSIWRSGGPHTVREKIKAKYGKSTGVKESPSTDETDDGVVRGVLGRSAPAVREVEKAIRAKYPDLTDFDVYERHDGSLYLADIEVARGARQRGVGTAAMRDLTAFADEHGKRIILQPGSHDPRHGTTSRGRLVRWYKGLGFKPRGSDFSLPAGSMYRDPVALGGKVREGPATPTETTAFKAWFGDSKAVDVDGAPAVVYHGTARPDRIDARFRPSRATSGPMAFFTDDPAIASNYAKGKADTSLAGQDRNYEAWFTVKVAGSRGSVNIDRAWWHLSPEMRAEIATRAPRVGQDEETGSTIMLHGPGHTTGLGGYDQHIKEARGNHLAALVEEWLNSGALFNDEAEFTKVLELAGLKGVTFFDPDSSMPAVYPVHLAIQNPLDTSAIPASVVDGIAQASVRRRPQRHGADAWDKRTRDPKAWVASLKAGDTHVWTSIPDWVTDVLKRAGYDGIKDTGGKMGGPGHTVWIPFAETQVKSATGNSGAFSPTDKSIVREPMRQPVEPKVPTGYEKYHAALDVTIPQSREKLAAKLGVSPSMVSTAMNALERAGVARRAPFASNGWIKQVREPQGPGDEIGGPLPVGALDLTQRKAAFAASIARRTAAQPPGGLVGRTARNGAELAALLWPYDAPHIEEFHFVAINPATDKIITHMGSTSDEVDVALVNDPDQVRRYIYGLRRAVRLGGTQVVMSHNHPAGTRRPSVPDDTQLTAQWRAIIERAVPGAVLVEHIILAGTAHVSLDPATLDWVVRPTPGAPAQEWLADRGPKAWTADDVARAVPAPGTTGAVLIDRGGHAVAWVPVQVGVRGGALDYSLDRLARDMQETGASSAVLVGGDEEAYRAWGRTIPANNGRVEIPDLVEVRRDGTRGRTLSDTRSGTYWSHNTYPDLKARATRELVEGYGARGLHAGGPGADLGRVGRGDAGADARDAEAGRRGVGRPAALRVRAVRESFERDPAARLAVSSTDAPVGPVFYSRLARALETPPFPKAPAAEWRGWLRNVKNISQREVEYVLGEYLDKAIIAGQTMTAAELQGAALGGPLGRRAKLGTSPLLNDPSINRTEEAAAAERHERDGYDEDDYDGGRRNRREEDASRYDEYFPGPVEDYREIVFTSPQSRYSSPHFDDDGYLAHARVGTVLDADGRRLLFIGEVQSDLHQAGRERGYHDEGELAAARAALTAAENAVAQASYDYTAAKTHEIRAARALTEEEKRTGRIEEGPAERAATNAHADWMDARNARDAAQVALARVQSRPQHAPFKNTNEWAGMALKYLMRLAVDEGLDGIALTDGATISRALQMGEGEGNATFYDTMLPKILTGDVAKHLGEKLPLAKAKIAFKGDTRTWTPEAVVNTLGQLRHDLPLLWPGPAAAAKEAIDYLESQPSLRANDPATLMHGLMGHLRSGADRPGGAWSTADAEHVLAISVQPALRITGVMPTDYPVIIFTPAIANKIRAGQAVMEGRRPYGRNTAQVDAYGQEIEEKQSVAAATASTIRLLYLSSPATDLWNLVGTGTHHGLIGMSQPAARAFDYLLSLASGVQTKAPLSLELVKASRHAVDQVVNEKVRKAAEIKYEARTAGIGTSIFARVLEARFKMLAAEDRFWLRRAMARSVAEQAAVLARSTAKAHGWDRTTQRDYAHQLAAHPTEAMLVQGYADARFVTFTNENLGPRESAGTWTKAGATWLAGQSGIGKVLAAMFVPFTFTPGNVGARAIEYTTPFGFATAIPEAVRFVQAVMGGGAGGKVPPGKWEGDIPFGPDDDTLPSVQRRLAERLARSGTAFGFAALGFLLATLGLLERDDNQRWSVRIKALKGRRLSLSRFQPFAAIIEAGAAWQEAIESGNMGDGKVQNRLAKDLAAGVIDNPMVESTKGVRRAMDNPATGVPSLARERVAGLVPSIVGQAAKVADDTVRNAETTLERTKNRIPGLSRTLPPRYDALGEAVTRSTAQRVDAVVGLGGTPEHADTPLWQWVEALGVRVQFPRWTDEMTAKERSQRQLKMGTALRVQLTPLYLGEDARFDKMTRAEQQERVRAVVAKVWRVEASRRRPTVAAE